MNIKNLKYSTLIPFSSRPPYRHIQNDIRKSQNKVFKIRKSSYKGHGRPKKTDFALVKFKDIADYRAMEIFFTGFSTNYTN